MAGFTTLQYFGRPIGALVFGAAVMAVAAGSAGAATTLTPAQVPAECAGMDMTPYSAPQPLTVVNSHHKTARFNVEIADTNATQEQGLMCRTDLGTQQGMLFEFDGAQPRTFWMHNTLVGLDIIYIAPNGKIVSIARNAKPLDDTPLPSKYSASGVLEIQAGLSYKLGLKPGDTVTHPFFHK